MKLEETHTLDTGEKARERERGGNEQKKSKKWKETNKVIWENVEEQK